MRFLRRKPSKKAEIPVYLCPYCQKIFGKYSKVGPPQIFPAVDNNVSGEKRHYFVG